MLIECFMSVNKLNANSFSVRADVRFKNRSGFLAILSRSVEPCWASTFDGRVSVPVALFSRPFAHFSARFSRLCYVPLFFACCSFVM